MPRAIGPGVACCLQPESTLLAAGLPPLLSPPVAGLLLLPLLLLLPAVVGLLLLLLPAVQEQLHSGSPAWELAGRLTAGSAAQLPPASNGSLEPLHERLACARVPHTLWRGCSAPSTPTDRHGPPVAGASAASAGRQLPPPLLSLQLRMCRPSRYCTAGSCCRTCTCNKCTLGSACAMRCAWLRTAGLPGQLAAALACQLHTHGRTCDV